MNDDINEDILLQPPEDPVPTQMPQFQPEAIPQVPLAPDWDQKFYIFFLCFYLISKEHIFLSPIPRARLYPPVGTRSCPENHWFCTLRRAKVALTEVS